MNDAGREALVAAALKGVRQIRRQFADGLDGRCAMGVLAEAAGLDIHQEPSPWRQTERAYQMKTENIACALCGEIFRLGESALIAHLNDIHDCDFLTIARKLGTE